MFLDGVLATENLQLLCYFKKLQICPRAVDGSAPHYNIVVFHLQAHNKRNVTRYVEQVIY